MSNKKMTRSEFMRRYWALGYRGLTSDLHIANLAEEAGVEWLPEPVEPRYGDMLTEDTRLVDQMAVVTVSHLVWQYDAPTDRWVASGVAGDRTTSDMLAHLARIIYVPSDDDE